MDRQAYINYPALSYSGASRLLKSPANYKVRTPDTAAMAFGRALHTFVLEPEKFDSQYVVAPSDLGRSNSNKYKEWAASQGSRQIIKAEELSTIREMGAALRTNKLTERLLYGEQVAKEKAYVWDSDGVACKFLGDAVGGEYVLDLKKTKDVLPHQFANSVARYKYHLQAAMGLEATGKKVFYFICVEDVEPYHVGVYELDTDALKEGQRLLREAKAIYANCQLFGFEEKLPETVQILRLPRWAIGG